MADLTLNPTAEELAIAESEGWYFSEDTRVWSKYENNVLTILDLKKFEGAQLKNHFGIPAEIQ